MSQEILYIVNGMDKKEINLQLAIQCAPVIAGIKISNLLIVQKENEEILEELLIGTGLMYYRMFRLNDKVTYLIFRRGELEEYLLRDEVKSYLNKMGYQGLNIGKILLHFQERYWKFMTDDMEFPHEMGILLGYPIEDVKGFVENDGKNFLYSGYWKVYSDLNEKIKLFHEYDRVQEELIYLVSEGTLITEMVNSISY